MLHLSLLNKIRVLTVLIALFTLVPIVNAAHCQLEADSDHLSFVFETEQSSDHVTIDSHSHCHYGHCHHSIANLPPENRSTAARVSLFHAWPDDEHAHIFIQDALIRPPKA